MKEFPVLVNSSTFSLSETSSDVHTAMEVYPFNETTESVNVLSHSIMVQPNEQQLSDYIEILPLCQSMTAFSALFTNTKHKLSETSR